MSLIISKQQEKFLNQNFNGTELCSECGIETDFEFNPMKDEYIICSHCHTKMLPCSLCNSGKCCDDCENKIKASLLYFSDMWDEKVNGEY